MSEKPRFTIEELLEALGSIATLNRRMADLECEVQKLRESILMPVGTSGGMKPTEKTLYTRREAARALGVSVTQLGYRIRAGELKRRKNGRNTMIHRSEIERYARSDHGPIRRLRADHATAIKEVFR